MKLIAGIPLELSYHNIISNNKCDGLKNRKIGQSAAKILNKIKNENLSITKNNII